MDNYRDFVQSRRMRNGVPAGVGPRAAGRLPNSIQNAGIDRMTPNDRDRPQGRFVRTTRIPIPPRLTSAQTAPPVAGQA
jgi:hypothetical protein